MSGVADVRNGSRARPNGQSAPLRSDAEQHLQPRFYRRGETRIDDWRANEAHRQRIDRHAAAFDLEMEMRPGRQAGRADIADDLAAAHDSARLGGYFAHVA